MKEKSDMALGLALAGEWGFTLAILTCLGGFFGYWLGQLIHNGPLMILLVLIGIAGGFTIAFMRMMKVQQDRLEKK